MSSDHSPPITPEPTGGPAYQDPLLDYIGTPVCVEWCGREVEGVVHDVNLAHDDHCFEGRLTIATGSATITVTPDDLLE